MTRVPKRSKEVTGGTQNDKEMPHEMAVAFPLSAIECQSGGVGDASGQQQENARQRPHRQIEAGREARVPQGPCYLQRHTEDGQAPHDAEKRPAPWATQDAQRERSICTGNEQENCYMVKHSKHTLCPA